MATKDEVFKTRITEALGGHLLSAKKLSEELINAGVIDEGELRHRLVSEDRKKLAVELHSKGFSLRKIAAITGASHVTIKNDLDAVQDLTEDVKNLTPAKTGSAETVAHREEIAEKARAAGVVKIPKGILYRVVYADPPWSYGNTQPDYHKEQRDHYPVMELGKICEEPVNGMTEKDAVLFLWATSPILEEAFQVVNAWGFKYKTSFVWDKIKHNMGHYNSVRHELLLVCTKGSCPPDTKQLFDSVQNIERTEHSVKPVEFYDIIETLYTHGKRIEMYARKQREGWDAYGHVAQIAA